MSAAMSVVKVASAPRWAKSGLTQGDLSELLDISDQTCNRHIAEMVRVGYLKAIGTRKISTGRTANVYAITPAGVESLGGGS
jgi:predicted ArsR family transcriptional regulator